MPDKQVLIISFWNPTDENPHQGNFIQDQAAAICNICYNFVFLQVNVLKSNRVLFKKSVEETEFFKGTKITINIYSVFWKFLYVNPWWLARFVYRIINKRKDIIKPEIIHANVIHPCGIVGYLLSEKMGTKLIISEHWSKAERFLKHPIYRNIALKAYRKCFAIICVSEFLSQKITKATGHSNMRVVPNIIDTGIFNYQPKPTDSKDLNLMCVASWRPPKRLDLIYEALCSFAPESSKPIKFRVVGNGLQTQKYKALRLPENLTVEWLGYLDKSTIAGLLHSTDLFVHASDIETFSIVTVEALSTGTPVLASNVGALPELINEKNGILTENNPEHWLHSIRKAVSKQFDYEAISKAQDKYSPDNVGNRIVEIYRQGTDNLF
jgi:glycosyltransferase involved in cell wall biosynthesis